MAQLGISDTPPDPADPAWRSDCLSRARHTRLVAAAAEPGRSGHDPAGPVARTAAGQGTPATAKAARESSAIAPRGARDRADHAEALSAAVTRDLLGDFAPALLLLPATERCRVRALLACARLLFDFARQPGPEGERLAGIARCEHNLEQALSGRPVEQPILWRMGQENSRRRWPPDALDELVAGARRCAVRPRTAPSATAEAEERSLARAVGTALLEERINSEVTAFAGALMRLCELRGEGLVEEEARRECVRLRPRLLRAPRGLVELPAPYRRAGAFCLLVALRLLSRIEEAQGSLAAAPFRLSAAARIGMLLRATWFNWSGRRRE